MATEESRLLTVAYSYRIGIETDMLWTVTRAFAAIAATTTRISDWPTRKGETTLMAEDLYRRRTWSSFALSSCAAAKTKFNTWADG